MNGLYSKLYVNNEYIENYYTFSKSLAIGQTQFIFKNVAQNGFNTSFYFLTVTRAISSQSTISSIATNVTG